MDSVNLSPGESILWSGEPGRHPLLRPSDRTLIPFSLLWGGVSLYGAASTLRPGFVFTNGFLELPVLAFAGIGIYLIAGRFVVRAIASRRTRYVVTNARVVVIGGLSGRSVASAYLVQLPPPVVTENEDGSGTIAFGSTQSRRSTQWGADPVWPPVFREIPNVLHVRDLIVGRQTAAGAAS